MIVRQHQQVFEVTTDLDFFMELYQLTDQIKAELSAFVKQLNGPRPLQALKDMETMRIKYPHTPQVVHVMMFGYMDMENNKKVDELRNFAIENFPNYIHTRLDKATEFMEQGNYKGALAILGEKLTIKHMYPDRNKFCYDEYMAFEREVIRYLVGIDNTDAAEDKLAKLADEFLGHRCFNEAVQIVREAEMKFFGNRSILQGQNSGKI